MMNRAIIGICLITNLTFGATFFWITGAEGTGKSSTVKCLKQNRPDWLFVDVDEFQRRHNVDNDNALHDRPGDWYAYMEPLYVASAIVDKLAEKEDHRNSVIIVDFSGGRYMMHCVMRIFESLGHFNVLNKVYHVHLYCSDEVQLNRLRQRDGDQKAQNRYKGRHWFRHAPDKSIKMIDVNSITPEQAADSVLKYIYKKCYWLPKPKA